MFVDLRLVYLLQIDIYYKIKNKQIINQAIKLTAKNQEKKERKNNLRILLWLFEFRVYNFEIQSTYNDFELLFEWALRCQFELTVAEFIWGYLWMLL